MEKKLNKKNKRKEITSDEKEVKEEGLSYNDYIEKEIKPDGNYFYRVNVIFTEKQKKNIMNSENLYMNSKYIIKKNSSK